MAKKTTRKQRRKQRQQLDNWIQANDESDVVFAAAGDVEISLEGTESGKAPSAEVVAYTGGLLSLPNFPFPAVINVAGVRAMDSNQLPFLRDHKVTRPIGHGSPKITSRDLRHVGALSLDNADRSEVVNASKEGFRWQASVGGRIPDLKKHVQIIKTGQKVKVNSQVFTGPIAVINAFLWKETSFTAVGADEGVASAAIAASESSNQRVSPMNEFEKWLDEQGIDQSSLTASQVANLKAAWEAMTANPGDVAANDGGAGDAQVIDIEAIVQSATRAATAAAVQATSEQNQRGRRIDRLFANYSDTSLSGEQIDQLRAQIDGGEITEEGLHLQLIQASRSRGSTSNVGGGGSSVAEMNMQITASLGAKAGLTEEQNHDMLVEAGASDDEAEAAISRGRKRFGIKSLIRAICRQENHHVDEVDDDAIACALHASSRDFHTIQASSGGFSTTSLAGILSRLANKAMLAAYAEADNGGVAFDIASVASTNDFKKFTRYRMTEAGVMDEVPATGEIPHGELTEEEYENQVKTYGKMFALSRQMMRNDDLDAFLQIPRMIGRMGRHSLERAVITTLVDAPTGTNTGFFQSAPTAENREANYLAGAGTALSLDSLDPAYTLFLNQTDSDGKPIMIDPQFLLVTNHDIIVARKLFTDTQYRLGSGTGANELINNQWQGMFNPIKSSYLHRLGASPSSTQWYLGSNPTQDVSAIQIALLDGQRTPVINQSETSFNTLGMQMRGYYDFGVALQDYRAMVKVEGLA